MAVNEVGPLKLKEFSCHMKVDERSTASNPTCVLNFVINKRNEQLESNKDKELSNKDEDEKITFEMESSVLDTFLEGLHHIQNHLSTAAIKST